MKKLLFVSPETPFDNISHAGGKTINFYLKGLMNQFDVTIVSLTHARDLNKIDLQKYKINHKIVVIKDTFFHKLGRRILDWSYFYSCFDPYAQVLPLSHESMLIRALSELREEGYRPDILIMEYTGVVMLADKIKKLFPDCKLVASEHDVTFLGLKRVVDFTQGVIKKKCEKIRYEICKRKELKSISICDLVIPHNAKDAQLLLDNSVQNDKIFVIVPYYMQLKGTLYNKKSRNIFFFGAMGRSENFLSAIWFIDNVLPLLDNIKFVVIGGNPPKELERKAADNVIITGFVDDVQGYFSQSLCMVAPLVLGAGIKVKILEAMSAGIVTLTNDIGIEGIPAKPGVDYLHCETAQDYVNTISKLINDEIDGQIISENAQKFVKNHFCKEESINNYAEKLVSL
jgi:glycosyltransferase involved in cell wall biosynthesis